MTEHSPNEQFRAQSFMDGANAAYIDGLAARHAADEGAVDAEWAAFFKGLGDSDREAEAMAQGPPGRARTGRRCPPTTSPPR